MNRRAVVWVLAVLLVACGVPGCTGKGRESEVSPSPPQGQEKTGRQGYFAASGGVETRGIVYVIDRSGSMTDLLDFVKSALKRSIGELSEDDMEFHVIFYSSGPPVEMPARRLVKATEANKQLAFKFIDGVIAEGETDPTEAIERAFAVKPEIIYLLADSEFDRAIVDLVKRLNVDANVTVHTIAFLCREGESVLKDIAAQNGGEYRFWSEKDLADLVKAAGS